MAGKTSNGRRQQAIAEKMSNGRKNQHWQKKHIANGRENGQWQNKRVMGKKNKTSIVMAEKTNNGRKMSIGRKNQ